MTPPCASIGKYRWRMREVYIGPPTKPYRIRKQALRDFYRKRTVIVMRNGSYIYFDEGPPADVFVGSNNDGPIYME